MIKRILITTACLVMASSIGCATFGSKASAEKENEGDPEWLEDLKSLGGLGGNFGMSRESREIEKNLGRPSGL